MVAVARTGSTRGRGRPRTFDEEAVLDALTLLFSQQGYEATSVADIARATGLNKSSLYNTFGSKQEVFARVLDRYIAARLDMLGSIAEASGGGIDAIHRFLDMVKLDTTSELGRHGCLAITSGAELGASSPEMARVASGFRDQLASSIASLVDEAADAGELDPTATDHYATMLMAFMLGLAVSVRSGATADEIDRLLEAAHTTVDSWRR